MSENQKSAEKTKKVKQTPYRLEDIQSKRRFRRHLKITALILLLIVIIGGVFYLVLELDVLKVRTFEVVGNNTVKTEEILSRAKKELTGRGKWAELLGQENILLWKDGRLANVSEALPRLAEVEVERDLFERKILLAVRERERQVIWCLRPIAFPRKCLWTDNSGVLFDEGPNPEGNLLRVVNDYTGRNLRVGDAALNPAEMTNVMNLLDLIDSFDLVAKELKIENLELKEGMVEIVNGPQIFFSLTVDPRFGHPVIDNLRESGEWKRIDYLDLRVENRAYYSYE